MANVGNCSRIGVLIVEDHVLTRLGLKVALNKAEDIVVVGEAGDGEEAVRLALSLNPDVILMDVGMPIMDGIQAVQRITEHNHKARVIMLTQHDSDSDIMASLAAGACGYCLKDVQPDRLFTAIRAVNAGDAWLDAAIAGRVLARYGANLTVADDSQMQAIVKNSAELSTKTAPAPLLEPLSARENEVLSLIVSGLANQQIADKLVISLATVKTHVRNILNKLAVDDRTQAAVQAMRRGLV